MCLWLCTLTSHSVFVVFFKRFSSSKSLSSVGTYGNHTSEQQNLKMNWAHGGIHLAGFLLFCSEFEGKIHIVRHLHIVGVRLCYARKKRQAGEDRD